MEKAEQRPLLLAIETSGHLCGIALYSSEIVYTSVFEGRYLHDRFLAAIVQRALTDLGLSGADVNAVALSAGPGSFTGLRIGAAFAKAFCFTQPPYLITIPTLESIAYAAKDLHHILDPLPIVVLLPSHRNLLYTQEYDFAHNRITSLVLLEEDQIIERYNHPQWIAAGPGAPLCPQAKQLPVFNTLDPRFVAQRALSYWHDHRFTDPTTFVPIYGQDVQPKPSKQRQGPTE